MLNAWNNTYKSGWVQFLFSEVHFFCDDKYMGTHKRHNHHIKVSARLLQQSWKEVKQLKVELMSSMGPICGLVALTVMENAPRKFSHLNLFYTRYWNSLMAKEITLDMEYYLSHFCWQTRSDPIHTKYSFPKTSSCLSTFYSAEFCMGDLQVLLAFPIEFRKKLITKRNEAGVVMLHVFFAEWR